MQKSAVHTLLFLTFFIGEIAAQSQSNWSLSSNLGIASEQNLGDTGLRLSSKASHHFDRWSVFVQAGTFQMLRPLDEWTGAEAFRDKRSLSTFNLDLGAGFDLLNKSKVRLNVNAAGAYRTGRQLWPEIAVVTNGHREDFYTFDKISEIGYALGLDFSVRATDRLWIGLDAHCHSYNFFAEYVGVGLGLRVDLE